MDALLDTHSWAWSMDAVERLTRDAAQAIDQASVVSVSVVSVFEIAQKVRLGKWPEMESRLPGLIGASDWQFAKLCGVTPEIAHLAGTMAWPHRDPFDRLIAATALVHGWVLVSADTAFDTLIGLRRVW